MEEFVDQQLKRLCKDYQILNVLGKGSFATVYLGIEKSSKLAVALKCMDINRLIKDEKDLDLRNLKEKYRRSQLDIMERCHSPNIVRYINKLEEGRWSVLILQYCADGTLLDHIGRRGGSLSQKESIEVLAQLAMGFAVLHQKKIIHRDLKAENILISNGIYKIADFGLAKDVKQLTNRMLGTMAGSRITMAPEVLNDQPYDAQADMWSLGVIYFEMLTGQLPFRGIPTQKSVIRVQENLQKLSISGGSKDFLRRALVINPNQRLKWVQLYKMYNNRAGIFQGYEPPIRESREEPVHEQIQPQIQSYVRPYIQPQPPKPILPKKFPPRFDQDDQEKLLQMQLQEVRQFEYQENLKKLVPPVEPKSEHQSIIQDKKFQKMKNNFQMVLKVYQNTVVPLVRYVKEREYLFRLFAKTVRYMNCFCLLVMAQINKIIDQNSQFFHPELIDDIDKNREIIGNNDTIWRFNEFGKYVKRQYGDLMNDFRDLNYPDHKGVRKVFNGEQFIEQEQIRNLQERYLPYACNEQAHIACTIKTFNRLFDHLLSLTMTRELTDIIHSMRRFMSEEYERAVINRRK